MTTSEFLSHLKSLDIRLSADGDRLKCNAPRGAITESIRQQLADRKTELLDYLKQRTPVGETFIVPPVERYDRNPRMPVSLNQQRLWFLEQLEPGSTAYIIPVVYRVTGRLDIGVFERSLNAMIHRHEILRTRFESEGGTPVQVISPPQKFHLSITDIRHLPPDEQEWEIRRYASREARSPFDLASGPLLRCALLQVNQAECILYLTFHHIIFDVWSFSVFMGELSVIYNSLIAGKQITLQPLAVQYPDYACWQRQWLTGEVLDRQLVYWRKQLADHPALLELPTDRPRPAVQTFDGDFVEYLIPAEIIRALKAISRSEGATLFMTCLAALNLLFYRYTNQTDITIGSPVANRNRIELEGLIGFFVNTLVLRNRFTPEMSFRELLKHVRRILLEAHANQHVPFEMLVEQLQPPRQANLTPFFQTMFTLESSRGESSGFDGLTFEHVRSDTRTAKFDLSFYLYDLNDGLTAQVEFNTDLFDASTIRSMLRHYETLLSGIAADPDRPLHTFELLDPSDHHRLTHDLAVNTVNYPRNASIHSLFEEQAKRVPDAVAIICGRQQLTYRNLNEQANQLAHRLIEYGVRPGDRVGFMLHRGTDVPVTILAILKAGAVYVPLDAGYPAERLKMILADIKPPVLISHSQLISALGEFNDTLEVFVLDLNRDEQADMPIDDPGVTVTGDDPAYIMYTSGSTGRPKGVIVPHRGVVRLVIGEDYAELGPEQVILQLAPISFDASTFELWGALLHGGRCVIYPARVPDSKELGHVIQTHGVNTLWLTASLFNLLITESPEIFRPIRQLLTGGEALSVPHIRRALAHLPQTQLINGYGPTECTTFACCYRIPAALPDNVNAIPIGRPIANTTAYVLDDRLQPVPAGVWGELYIGGDGVAIGYLNQPELTRQRFVTDPFRHGENARLYKTGDRVRRLTDGNLEFGGRRDNQIKLRGFRIEPGEIESILIEHHAIAAAAVILQEQSPGDKRLVAYLVPADDRPLDKDGIRTYAARQLPDYMVPSSWIQIQQMPLSPNGKIDRQALSRIESTEPAQASMKYVEPQTPIQRGLAEIWTEVLGRDTIGIHDHFFNIGGHSLMATQVISRVNDTFNVSIPVARMFERPTIAGFADLLCSLQREQDSSDTPPLVPVERGNTAPLSFAQQRLWFISQMEPDNPVYNIPMAMGLEGKLDLDALQKSVNRIITRHETLRSRFRHEGGKPVQIIDAIDVIDMPVIDMSHIAPADRDLESQRFINEAAFQPFDLTRDYPLRVQLMRFSTDHHILLITMHHIASDGWSLGILFNELTVLYEAYARGGSTTLSPLPIQYADFAIWQRQWLSGNELERQLGYWRSQLSGELPVLELPLDHPRPAVQSFNGEWESYILPKKLSDSIKQLSRREQTTLFMTLLAAFQVLLHRYARQNDIITGSPVANRNRSEIEGLIGFFVNMLVLRTQIDPERPFIELMQRVRKTTLDAYSHQDMPFEKLVESLGLQRDLSRSPLIQMTFALQNAPMEPLDLVGLSLRKMMIKCETVRFDLEAQVWDRDDGLVVTITYNTDLFDASTIQRMLGHYHHLLESIVSNPSAPVRELTMLSDSEYEQVITEWNHTATDYPRKVGIPDLFTRRAESHPDAIAIVHGNDQVSYGELEAKTDQLARYLQSLNVTTGTPVAIALDRSIDMVVAMLGILKAGGIYIPLDPDYPEQRQRLMIEDSHAAILITRESLWQRPAPDHVRLVCLDRESSAITSQYSTTRHNETGGDNPAYIMYTSGSTGRPKGVCVPHRGVVRLVCETDYIQLTGSDRVAQVSNCSFDAATFEIWGALLNGSRLVIFDQEQILSPGEFASALQEAGVTTLFLTTAMFNLMAREQVSVFAGFKHVLFGGEAVDPGSVRRVLAGGKPARLLHVYGPTENTTFSTWYEINKVDDDATTVPIGRPIANTTAYVLDEHQRPVPVGVPGELYLGGDGLATGYLNRDELTAEKFVRVALPGLNGSQRLYRTGDLVCRRADGELIFISRMDNQVKLRGFRIEPGEVEAVLLEHEQVSEAVVQVREDKPGDRRLTGYVVGDNGNVHDSEMLRQYLKDRLPAYMVPATIMILDHMPLTPNGKVDREALPRPADHHRPVDAHGTSAAPESEMEILLAGIWQQVLGISHVMRHDNFFDLGGHSLLAMEVVAKLQEQAGVKLNPMELMLQNLSQVAAQCDNLRETKQAAGTGKKARAMLAAIRKMVTGEKTERVTPSH